MQQTPKDRENLSKVLAFKKQQPDAKVKDVIKSCKLKSYDYSRLRRLGLMPNSKTGIIKKSKSNYAKIAAAESANTEGKMVLVMGSPSQVGEFLKGAL